MPSGIKSIVLLAGLAAVGWAFPAAATTPSAPQKAPSSPLSSRQLSVGSLASVVEKVLLSVVSIRVIGEQYQPTELRPGEPVPRPRKLPFRAGGSGVIVDARNGLIATNRHVVKDATTILVRLHDGREIEARLIGADYGTDIAMLKIDLENLNSISLGNSSRLRVGDFVLAIGNPFGLEGSASSGIVSGLMRSDIGYDVYESFIQIDAAVNPGNSGGALVNLDGELIGITTAVGRQGARNAGIAFAIPVNIAKRVGQQIYLHGRMRRGSIGLKTSNIRRGGEVAQTASMHGALITEVQPNSPAAQAGIKPGSVIVRLNGETVENNRDYIAYFGSSAVGETIELELITDGTSRMVTLVVSDETRHSDSATVAENINGLGGLSLTDVGPGSAHYGQLRGASVGSVQPGSPAFASGLRVDDVIVSVNRLNVSAVRHVTDLVLLQTPIVEVGLVRQGVPYTIKLGH